MIKFLRILAILPLPGIYALISWRTLQGRFFVDNHGYFADPGYAYLLNGQAVLNDKVIYHIDHPGTPVQIFNGLIQQLIWRTNLFGTKSELLEWSVVATAEQHQLAIAAILIWLQTIGVLLVGLALLRYVAFWVAPVAQFLLVLMAQPLLGDLIANKPEGFLLALQLFALALLILIIARKPARWQKYLLLSCFSLLLALTLTSKISAVLLVLLLPLALIDWRSVVFAYLLITVSVLLILSTVWPMMPTAWRFWTYSGDGALSDPIGLLDRSLGGISGNVTASLIAIGALTAILGALAALIAWIATRAPSHSSKPAIPFVSAEREMRWVPFFLVSSVILLGQIVIASARNAPWIVPGIALAATATAVSLASSANLLDKLSRLPNNLNFTSKRVFTIVGLSLSAALTLLAWQQIPPEPDGRVTDEIQSSEAAWLARGDLLVYDWSIGFSGLPYGNECAALIFGDGFARQVVSPLLAEKCPNHRLGALVNNRLQEYGNGSVSCQELRRELETGRRVAFVRPSGSYVPREFDLETIAEAGGWQFSAVTIKACL